MPLRLVFPLTIVLLPKSNFYSIPINRTNDASSPIPFNNCFTIALLPKSTLYSLPINRTHDASLPGVPFNNCCSLKLYLLFCSHQQDPWCLFTCFTPILIQFLSQLCFSLFHPFFGGFDNHFTPTLCWYVVGFCCCSSSSSGQLVEFILHLKSWNFALFYFKFNTKSPKNAIVFSQLRNQDPSVKTASSTTQVPQQI